MSEIHFIIERNFPGTPPKVEVSVWFVKHRGSKASIALGLLTFTREDFEDFRASLINWHGSKLSGRTITLDLDALSPDAAGTFSRLLPV